MFPPASRSILPIEAWPSFQAFCIQAGGQYVVTSHRWEERERERERVKIPYKCEYEYEYPFHLLSSLPFLHFYLPTCLSARGVNYALLYSYAFSHSAYSIHFAFSFGSGHFCRKSTFYVKLLEFLRWSGEFLADYTSLLHHYLKVCDYHH